MRTENTCRFCGNELKYTFVDLGMSPLANAYLTEAQRHGMEPFYPLHVYVCEECFLVQLPRCKTPEELFADYAYFSSYSESWLKHAKAYAEAMIERFGFAAESLVTEIASNDGYLLQYFKERGVSVLGIEPAGNVARVAQQAGIETIIRFFGEETARTLAAQGRLADLLVGNNVLAHVPDLRDFVGGLKIALKPRGVITMEFPHLLRLMEENQFDTIYHEHFSYFSFTTVGKIFDSHGLRIFDVEELPTHGGSLRIYAGRQGETREPTSERVAELREREKAEGFDKLARYRAFNEQVRETQLQILEFMVGAKREGKSLVGYGAPAKGNTLLNFCGLGVNFFDYTVDRSPHKQGRFLPGTHIPICSPDRIRETKPDYVVILPWNVKDEIMEQMGHIREWGGRFLVLIPEVRIYQ